MSTPWPSRWAAPRAAWSGSGVNSAPTTGPASWRMAPVSWAGSGLHSRPISGTASWGLPRMRWGSDTRLDSRKVSIETVQGWTDIGQP